MWMTMTAAIGLVLVLLGWLMGRWAGRYDVQGWLTGALWRLVFKGGWKGIRANPSVEGVLASDPELKRTLSEKAAELQADRERIGVRGVVVKHGARLLLARLAGMLSFPVLLAGVLLLGLAAYRWLG